MNEAQPLLSPVSFWACAAAFGVTAACEGLLALARRAAPASARPAAGGEAPAFPRPALALGLLFTTLIFWAAPLRAHAAAPPGVNLLWVAAAALPLLIAGWVTDRSRPRSERHFLAVLLAGGVLAFSELRIGFFSFPGLPVMTIGPVAGALIALFWLFLIVSLIEVAGLAPLLAGLIALAVGALGWFPAFVYSTVAGFTLAGILTGALLGRAAGGLLFSGGRSLEKAEILLLGYYTAVVTLAGFMKSVALAGIVLPLVMIIIAFTLIGLHGFEQTLLLRAKPRD